MDRAQQFRSAAAHLNRDRGKNGWRYPTQLRTLAVEHCRPRRLEKLPFSRIAAELGVSTVTLGRWIERAETVPNPLIEPDATPAPAAVLAVGLPSGQRIECLRLVDALDLGRGGE